MQATISACFLLAACSGAPDSEKVEKSVATGRPDSAGTPSAAGDSMAGMQHGAMTGMSHDSSASSTSPGGGAMQHGALPPASSMAGMDHSKMAPTAGSSAAHASGGMPSMQHAANAKASVSSMEGMDHGAMTSSRGAASTKSHAMSGMAMTPGQHAPQTPMTGMAVEHGAMPSSNVPASASPATSKLNSLAALLMGDSTVHTIVQRDTVLARLWSDSVVRSAILNRGRGGTHHE
jgi:hypothetical protein